MSRALLILVLAATMAAVALTIGQAGARSGDPCRPAAATAPGHPGAAPGHPAFIRAACSQQE